MNTIENNVALPEEPAAVKTKPATKRARAPKKPAISSAAASLIAALKFAKVAQSKAGTPAQQHCFISGGWLAASNGVITVASKIEEDLAACPHSTLLLEALTQCKQELSITQLNASTIAVKSGVFNALVPCVSFGELDISAPDPQIAAIDDRIRNALDCVMPLATDGAPNVAYASVLLQAQTAVATNGKAILEYWHGIDLPPNLLLPKAAAVAIVKAGKPLTGFGFSQSSATFYFEDGSFIKTQLYNERWPNYQVLFVDNVNAWELPEGFFMAVHAIANFSRNGIVHFDGNAVSSHELESEASTYKIEGLPSGMAYDSKYLTMLEHAFKQADFTREPHKVHFKGSNCRGVLMGVEIKKNAEAEDLQKDSIEDDIPF